MAGVLRESWMTENSPPSEWFRGKLKNETALWWAVTRQAAIDLLEGSKQNALDGLEFLWSTAPWLLDELFGIDERETRDEIIALLRRSRANIRVHDIASLRSLGGIPSDTTKSLV